MTVEEALDRLSKVVDKKRILVLAKDEEGNGYRQLSDIISDYRYDIDECEIGLEALNDKLKMQGYTERDVMTNGVPAVVLW